ncbi:SBBP repeat-containing protein [Crocinitomicaceae bacterium]|nr:SBBP repeat-containing protein [Crocinitomicaceae bacterium]
MKTLLLLFTLSFTWTSFSQIPTLDWAIGLGSTDASTGNDITVDNSGNVYTAGGFSGSVDFDPGPGVLTLNATSTDIFISKHDNLGNLIWAKQFGGSDSEGANKIAVDDIGNVYITGYFNATCDFDPGPGIYNLISSGGWDAFICKLDSNGNLIWAKSVGSTGYELGFGIDVDDMGSVYYGGMFNTGTVDFDPNAGVFNLTYTGSSGYDIFVSKLTSSGNLVWAKKIGGFGSDQLRSLTLDSNGNVLFTGTFEGGNVDFDPNAGVFNLSSLGGTDIFVSKLDDGGNFIWAKQFGGTLNNDWGYSIKTDLNNDVYTTGQFWGTADFDPGPGTVNLNSPGNAGMFVSKLSSTGNYIWAKKIDGLGLEAAVGRSIAIDSDNNVYTTGSFSGGLVDFNPGPSVNNLNATGGSYDIFVSKLDGSGNYLWAVQVVGDQQDNGQALCVDNNFEVYITGDHRGTDDFDPSASIYNVVPNGLYPDCFIFNLSQCQPLSGIDIQTACDSYIWPLNSTTYTNSTNAPTATLTNAAGCDSIVTLNLTINNSTAGTDTQVACDSYTWPLNSTTYTNTTNTPTATLTNAAGCDSIVTLNLTIKNSTAGTDTQVGCDSYTWPLNSTTYTYTTNTPTATLTNAAGCDSIVTLNLTINNSTAGTDTQVACDSYTWPLNSTTYTNSTNPPTATLTNAAGCDSIVTLNLTINNSNSGTDTQVACDAYTWPLNSTTYTNSTNTPTITLTNAAGCDSIVTLNLTINNSNTGTDTQVACDSYTWPLNSTTYTNSTNAPTVTLTNAAGCDSIVTLNLTVNSVSDNTTTLSSNTIQANNSGASYMWLNCDDNYTVISGETNQSYTPTANGNYAVELIENGCVDTSACVAITTIGIIENDFGKELLVYPNPTEGNFSIDLGADYSTVSISISDINGKLIRFEKYVQAQVISLSIKEPNGVYLLTINSGDKTAVIRLIKN